MLVVTDYPDPTNSSTPIAQAVAWIDLVQLASSDGSGRLVLWVNRSAAAAASTEPPVELLEFAPGDGVLPSLAEMMQDAEFAAHFLGIQAKLYGWIKAAKFPTATEV